MCSCPTSGLDDIASDKATPFRDWAEMGCMTIIPGPTISPAVIADYIIELCCKWNVIGLAYDRYNIDLIFNHFDHAGFAYTNTNEQVGEGLHMFSHPQGWQGFTKEGRGQGPMHAPINRRG